MSQDLCRFFPRGVDPYCKKIHGLQASIATGIDAKKRLEVHFDVEGQAMVGALTTHFDAQGADFAQAFEGVVGQDGARECLVRKGVCQADINTGRLGHAMPSYAKMGQAPNDSLFQPVNILFDKVTRPLQIHERVGHDLTRAVVGHLSASVGGHDRNVAGVQDMARQACQTLCKNRGVFTKPQLVFRFQLALGREILHGLVGVQIVGLTEELDLHVETEGFKAQP